VRRILQRETENLGRTSRSNQRVFATKCADTLEPIIIKTFENQEVLDKEIRIIQTLADKGFKNIPEHRGDDTLDGQPCIFLTRLG
jgi:hypothetical protein